MPLFQVEDAVYRTKDGVEFYRVMEGMLTFGMCPDIENRLARGYWKLLLAVQDAREAFGLHAEADNIDLAAEIRRTRDEGRGHFHDVTRLITENRRLRHALINSLTAASLKLLTLRDVVRSYLDGQGANTDQVRQACDDAFRRNGTGEEIMSVRAKFRVVSKTERTEDCHIVELEPVRGGSEENKRFYRYTPGGAISLSIVQKETADRFPIGSDFYVDFTPAVETVTEQPPARPSPPEQGQPLEDAANPENQPQG